MSSPSPHQRPPAASTVSGGRWQTRRWSLYAPVYDRVAARVLRSARRDAIATLDLKAGTRVLLLGGGTGLDLPFLPRDIELEVVDASPAMLRRCRERAEALGFDANVKLGNAMALDFPDGHFDVVIAHLIFAVVPEPQTAFDEALRVLASDGEMSLLDKGLRGQQPAGVIRRLLNPLARLLATNLSVPLDGLLEGHALQRMEDRDLGPGGLLRHMHLRKI
ncbi:methyltransferase domain-containing protein [Cobetia sp. 10Alg 146]|uniref:class I SAM-dependent methyltransferase n=1 Tax=Cobetia sp. 10Alg 146 TaxID=3040019 RepID=UPI00244A90BE|nr:class I SAM-dependent methyltransferase [Cobetia sp. 10Alg 146]MDH2292834.1 methyltransferase domain-containing protein [Cobetia sp. 10Alg 146]